MSELAVRCVDLGKKYRIGRLQPRYDTLRDSIMRGAKAAARAALGRRAQVHASEELWALRDVSMEIRQGEVVGIIGRNGAGKSTLLKILSRITEPTLGMAEVRGRVGSLLEVGTGFHPELTGRENIYLNGSLLGMPRSDITRKFDRIVEFAELERFIDTPVKHYSSGMYMRLAFSVAAHLEPDVLVIDEVLAVGDSEFQKKCLGRMDQVSREGRTVLFVSHNMNAVQRLCTRCVLLEQGRVAAAGSTRDVLARYLASGSSALEPGSWIGLDDALRTGSGAARYVALRYSSLNSVAGFLPYQEGPLELTLAIESDRDRAHSSIAAFVLDQHGTKLINADTDTLGGEIHLHRGRSYWQLRIDRLYLKPGIYVLGLWLADRFGDVFDRIESALQLEVVDLANPNIGARVDERYDGVVTCRFTIAHLPAGGENVGMQEPLPASSGAVAR
jgi:lipopolysaccharide transport system ATP-binding protein